MTITLHNDLLTATVDTLGAQLCSVQDASGTEYIWQADPELWARHAPLLFPIIARLKGGEYTVDDVTYRISNHGFARDSQFTLTEHSDTKAVFTLSDSSATKSMYPFSFLLTVTYELEGNQLKKSCQVENRDLRTMYYELGGHDGFRAPLEVGASMDDYAIVLPGVDTITPYGMDEDCMTTEKTRSISLTNGRIPLKPSTYQLDTIILDAPAQHRAQLVDKNGTPRITLDFPGFSYLGLWTTAAPVDTNYVCIEPWSSLPDAVFVGRALADKQGIRTLEPGKADILSYTTTFHTL